VHAVRALRTPRTVRWRDLGLLMERAGADGLPITALIDLLMGLILGYQAAVQLRQVGGNIYVAKLVALALTRELGPLMTAIVVAGRSGAAYAAALSTMKFGEELDALRTLGLDPYRFLVFPRALALFLTLPLLTLFADLMGILGGLVVAVTGLDLTANAYLIETRKSREVWDVASGVLKSLCFAVVIALVACRKGLAARIGAEGVGRAATSAVVTSIFLLVALDAAFGVLFHSVGL